MSELNPKTKTPEFKGLKIIKKEEITKNAFLLALEYEDKEHFRFKSGQYVKLRHEGEVNDYSIINAPYEGKLELVLKIHSPQSFTQKIFNHYSVGDIIEVSAPKGRFTLADKPSEKRTILGYAGGVGITPIISHLKHILHTEKGTRFYLFYSNKTKSEVILREELESLEQLYGDRLQVYYFYTQEEDANALFSGRIDRHKMNLIINQILHLDEDDEESTIWDAVDEILICGPAEMIKEVATGSYENGIRKKNIHFEFFNTYEGTIFPEEETFPKVENIKVEWKIDGDSFSGVMLENNDGKLLQQILDKGYRLPYSCKSGRCGACRCVLEEGEVEMTENEYLTDKELSQGQILTCTSVVLSDKIKLNFDWS
ncbi:2Fe-2S iron-sulfur cluster-binding protein [Riemerella anatipestifer]|uniref:2Fe-2S iron-sulfur cluster-binding protein n=1 Tax=Riemerella anatipestifer TaxID=34085 RepID=UPI002A888EDA|nr:2Fe-2S iron-sulfur cluster-binding protein [Riemerella anatipestifer]